MTQPQHVSGALVETKACYPLLVIDRVTFVPAPSPAVIINRMLFDIETSRPRSVTQP